MLFAIWFYQQTKNYQTHEWAEPRSEASDHPDAWAVRDCVLLWYRLFVAISYAAIDLQKMNWYKTLWNGKHNRTEKKKTSQLWNIVLSYSYENEMSQKYCVCITKKSEDLGTGWTQMPRYLRHCSNISVQELHLIVKKDLINLRAT